VGEARVAAESLESLNAHCAPRLPISWGEVHGFIEVESVIETSMVCLGEGNDELPSPLIKSVYVNTSLFQLVGWHQSDELEK
jgi:hypothetical protein